MADETENKSGDQTNRGGGIMPQASPQPTQEADKNTQTPAEGADEEGRFATAEDDGNSVLVDDEGYVGVSPEYRNDAYGKASPLRSEDKDVAAAEKAAREAEEQTTKDAENVSFRGFAPNLVHPSKRKNLSDEALRNRARIDEEARQEVRNGTDDGES